MSTQKSHTASGSLLDAANKLRTGGSSPLKGKFTRNRSPEERRRQGIDFVHGQLQKMKMTREQVEKILEGD